MPIEQKSMRLTRWQRLRAKWFLFAMGVKRHMTLGTRTVLIDGDRVFLIRQTYMPGWQFPGGGIEPGESAQESAARETLEETGYRVTGPMQLFGFYHNLNSATNRDHVAVFLCRDFEQAFRFAPNHEIADFGWFDRNDLPADTSLGMRRRLAEIFEGRAQSPQW
jgi:8-oxo-dGTP pyrophosphatase MutT (NUDIX family)